jgi:hypothetical protein
VGLKRKGERRGGKEMKEERSNGLDKKRRKRGWEENGKEEMGGKKVKGGRRGGKEAWEVGLILCNWLH